MAEYHIGTGCYGIYAGVTTRSGNLWKDKSDVTEEALWAVIDYLRSIGGTWTTKLAGTQVTLRLTWKEGDE